PSPPLFRFCNATANPELDTLSLHDALPISNCAGRSRCRSKSGRAPSSVTGSTDERIAAVAASARSLPTLVSRYSRSQEQPPAARSEEHTSELQSLTNILCRLLLEKKKNNIP